MRLENRILAVISFLTLLGPSWARAWWWKHPSQPIQIELSSAPAPDGSALVSGSIRFKDPVSGLTQAIPVSVLRELKLDFSFPSPEQPLAIAVGTNGSFSFHTPVIAAGNLNVFEAFVGQPSNQTRALRIAAWAVHREIRVLNQQLSVLQGNPRSKPSQITSLQTRVAGLELKLEILRDKIHSSLEVLASYNLPLQIGGELAEPARSTSFINGFYFETIFSPSGVVFSGQRSQAQIAVTDLRGRLPDLFGNCDRGSRWTLAGEWGTQTLGSLGPKALRENQRLVLPLTTPVVTLAGTRTLVTRLDQTSGTGKKLKTQTFARYAMPLEIRTPFAGPSPAPLAGLPTEVSLAVSQVSKSVRATSGSYLLPTSATVVIPSQISVISGKAGSRSKLALAFDQGLICSYGADNTLYRFESCKSGIGTNTSQRAGDSLHVFKSLSLVLTGDPLSFQFLAQARVAVTRWDSPSPNHGAPIVRNPVLSVAAQPGSSGPLAAYPAVRPSSVTLPSVVPILSGSVTGLRLLVQIDQKKRCTYQPDSTGRNFVYQSCVNLASGWSAWTEAMAADIGPFDFNQLLTLNFSQAPSGPVYFDFPIGVTVLTAPADTAPPTWQVTAPSSQLGYIQDLPAISAILADAGSSIDVPSIHAVLNGQDVTGSIAAACTSDLKTCQVAGTLPTPSEGPLTLELTGKDSAGNLSIAYTSQGTVDRTPPQILASVSFPGADHHAGVIRAVVTDSAPLGQIRIETASGIVCEGTTSPLAGS